MKRIIGKYTKDVGHWVGDGFPVRSLFSYGEFAQLISPFLLLDYAGPYEFEPSTTARGVGKHPHRGMETVTIVYEGEVSHRDSAGNVGTVGPGDVQWMTAGSGIVHEEYHSPAFTKSGGTLEMVQLWVNLPSKDKMTSPAYQEILKSDIPKVSLTNDNGDLKVIAGSYEGIKGPSKTFSDMNVWDLDIKSNVEFKLELPEKQTTIFIVLKGSLSINDDTVLNNVEIAILSPEGMQVHIQSDTPTKMLVLTGVPLNEPIVGKGPFVMNSRDEIEQAFEDYRNGIF